jgi:hypothetical protein
MELRRTAVRAIPRHVQAHIGDLHPFAPAEGLGGLHHLRRAELDDPSAFQAGEVVVEGVPGRFEMGVVFAQPVFLDQLGVAQKRQGPVDGGQADLRVPGSGFAVERIRIQMALGFADDFQHQLPLAGEVNRTGRGGFHGATLKMRMRSILIIRFPGNAVNGSRRWAADPGSGHFDVGIMG